MLLGQEVKIDDGVEWRVKSAQRGAGLCAPVALICWVAGQMIATIVFSSLTLIFIGYIVLQKFLVFHHETSVTRDERGDYSRISSLQLEY